LNGMAISVFCVVSLPKMPIISLKGGFGQMGDIIWTMVSACVGIVMWLRK